MNPIRVSNSTPGMSEFIVKNRNTPLNISSKKGL